MQAVLTGGSACEGQEPASPAEEPEYGRLKALVGFVGCAVVQNTGDMLGSDEIAVAGQGSSLLTEDEPRELWQELFEGHKESPCVSGCAQLGDLLQGEGVLQAEPPYSGADEPCHMCAALQLLTQIMGQGADIRSGGTSDTELDVRGVEAPAAE